MKILKKTLHIIFSSFLIWQTFMLTERILFKQQDTFLDSFVDALFLNLFVTGIFTIVYSFPAHRILPKRYYSIENPKFLRRVGNIIQIDLFKKLLTNTIWKEKNNKKHFFSGFRNGFSNLEIASMKSEFGHFLGFCVVMMLTILLAIETNYLIAALVFIVNIFFNFYPFMLQRFHRLRVNELKNRKVV